MLHTKSIFFLFFLLVNLMKPNCLLIYMSKIRIPNFLFSISIQEILLSQPDEIRKKKKRFICFNVTFIFNIYFSFFPKKMHFQLVLSQLALSDNKIMITQMMKQQQHLELKKLMSLHLTLKETPCKIFYAWSKTL